MIAMTICSGIGSPEVAMPHWQWCLQSEIEKAPRAVLKYRHGAQDARYPRGAGPALWGDFTTIRVRHLRRLGIELPEWIVAGTPCQSFSVAGLRGSMTDARGNLTLEFLHLAHSLRRTGSLRGIVWENVPGVLSTPDNAFGCFLAGLVGADAPLLPVDRQWGPKTFFHRRSYNVERTYGWKHCRWPSAGMVAGPWARATWRILDAKHFGLAQRRARVFVVASFGDWADPAEILFERQGMPRDFAESRGAGEDLAPTIGARTKGGGGLGTDFDCDGGLIEVVGALNTANGKTRPGDTLQCAMSSYAIPCGIGEGGQIARSLTASHTATGRLDPSEMTFITHSLRGDGFDASEDGTGRSTPLVPVIVGTLTGNGDAHSGFRDEKGLVAHCFDARQSDVIQYGDLAGPLDTDAYSQAIAFDTTQITSKANRSAPKEGDPCHPLAAGAHAPTIAFSITPMNSGKDFKGRETDIAQPLMAGGPVGGNQGGDFVAQQFGVRRITPTEAERLQGYPDGFTLIPYRNGEMADGPRYKMLGNSMAVPCLEWILSRVERAMNR